MLVSKAERANGQVVKVVARNTSQECSGCGAKVRKTLAVRIHKCAHCNLEIHRDTNGARVILGRAVVGPWSGYVLKTNDLVEDRRSGNPIEKIAA